MANYKDFAFQIGEYGRAEEYTDAAAVILAIKNILLTRKGNFPFNPNFGMNIEKYQFDLLDSTQVEIIKKDLLTQISTYIPSLDSIYVDVQIVEDDANILNADQGMIGISISTSLNSEPLTTNFLLYKDHEILQIFNETN